MLLSKKIASLITTGLVIVGINAFIPMQSVLQNYETQGYRVLSNKNVEGYTVRVKQPTSCENNTQVNNQQMKTTAK
jgi:cathepsin A (carboxypeptidase C)